MESSPTAQLSLPSLFKAKGDLVKDRQLRGWKLSACGLQETWSVDARMPSVCQAPSGTPAGHRAPCCAASTDFH